ncbi:MAG: hypothetical protein AB1609_10355 [Bacillota bacterium]
MLSEAEAEALYAERKRLVKIDPDWEASDDYGDLELSGVVETESGELLTLNCYLRVDVDPPLFWFDLIYGGTVPIRSLHMDTPHKNPDGEIVGIPHKHRWNGRHKRWAYSVPDFPRHSINEALKEFLRECKIEHEGRLPERYNLWGEF